MTDTDYSFGSLDENTQGPDNRADYRLATRAKAILELESRVPGADRDIVRNAECRIRDISVQGMSLLSREPLSVGALLPALVSLDSHSAPFKLTVEIVWCQPEKSKFLVGAKILESDETAYVEWVEAVASAMASS